MGQQNSCKTLIGVHSTMHLMHPFKVLQLLHTQLAATLLSRRWDRTGFSPPHASWGIITTYCFWLWPSLINIFSDHNDWALHVSVMCQPINQSDWVLRNSVEFKLLHQTLASDEIHPVLWKLGLGVSETIFNQPYGSLIYSFSFISLCFWLY